jgi:hypothetical protein
VHNIPQQDRAERAFNKLTRTFAAQVSALKEYRSKGEQKMTVQHVHVAEGGQAIVGNVNAPAGGGGARKKWRTTPCTWICTGHYVATRNRSGAGCRAERRLCGELRYVECTGLAAGARRGNKNAVKHGAMVAESIALRREVQALARMTRETMAAIG